AQSEIHWPVVPEVAFEAVDERKTGKVVKIKVPEPEACAVDILNGQAVEKGQCLHFILEVKDNGAPAMRTYKRVVLQTTNRGLRGASGKRYDTVTEALGHSTG
ncbi:hypothetical protein JX266_014116, partial [Neoarthrinium moseri]